MVRSSRRRRFFLPSAILSLLFLLLLADDVRGSPGMPWLYEVLTGHVKFGGEGPSSALKVLNEYSMVACSFNAEAPQSSSLGDLPTKYCEFTNVCFLRSLAPESVLTAQIFHRRQEDVVKVSSPLVFLTPPISSASTTTPDSVSIRILPGDQLLSTAPQPSSEVRWIEDSSVLISRQQGQGSASSTPTSTWELISNVYYSFYNVLKASGFLDSLEYQVFTFDNPKVWRKDPLLLESFIPSVTSLNFSSSTALPLPSSERVCFRHLLAGSSLEYRSFLKRLGKHRRAPSHGTVESHPHPFHFDLERRQWHSFMTEILSSLRLPPWNVETCSRDLRKRTPITITLISPPSISIETSRLFSPAWRKALETQLGDHPTARLQLQLRTLEDRSLASFAHQVELISQSLIVIGPNSPVLYPTLFMCPGTSVIALLPDSDTKEGGEGGGEGQPFFAAEAIYLTGINYHYLSPSTSVETLVMKIREIIDAK